MNNILSNHAETLKDLCKKYKVKRLYAFGSVFTDKFNKNSDIDFLVSFSEEVSLLDFADNYFDLKNDLAKVFNRNIDLITEDSLENPYFINEMEKTKTYIYG